MTGIIQDPITAYSTQLFKNRRYLEDSMSLCISYMHDEFPCDPKPFLANYFSQVYQENATP